MKQNKIWIIVMLFAVLFPPTVLSSPPKSSKEIVDNHDKNSAANNQIIGDNGSPNKTSETSSTKGINWQKIGSSLTNLAATSVLDSSSQAASFINLNRESDSNKDSIRDTNSFSIKSLVQEQNLSEGQDNDLSFKLAGSNTVPSEMEEDNLALANINQNNGTTISAVRAKVIRNSEVFFRSHWYSDDEINFLLEDFLRGKWKLEIMDAMSLNQRDGATLEENIRQRLSQLRSWNAGIDTLILPINLGEFNSEGVKYTGNHWVALYVRNPLQNASTSSASPTITYVDPFGSPLPQRLQEVIQREFNVKSENIVNLSIQFQFDACNCGPWIIEILKQLVQTNGNYVPEESFNIAAAREEQWNILEHQSSLRTLSRIIENWNQRDHISNHFPKDSAPSQKNQSASPKPLEHETAGANKEAIINNGPIKSNNTFSKTKGSYSEVMKKATYKDVEKLIRGQFLRSLWDLDDDSNKILKGIHDEKLKESVKAFLDFLDNETENISDELEDKFPIDFFKNLIVIRLLKCQEVLEIEMTKILSQLDSLENECHNKEDFDCERLKSDRATIEYVFQKIREAYVSLSVPNIEDLRHQALNEEARNILNMANSTFREIREAFGYNDSNILPEELLPRPPSCFIVYTSDSYGHRKWVINLRDHLNNTSIAIDTNNSDVSDDSYWYAEEDAEDGYRVNNHDFTIVIGTPGLIKKCEANKSNDDSDKNISMVLDRFARDPKSIIKILLVGTSEIFPEAMGGEEGVIDFTDPAKYYENLFLVIKKIFESTTELLPIIEEAEKKFIQRQADVNSAETPEGIQQILDSWREYRAKNPKEIFSEGRKVVIDKVKYVNSIIEDSFDRWEKMTGRSISSHMLLTTPGEEKKEVRQILAKNIQHIEAIDDGLEVLLKNSVQTSLSHVYLNDLLKNPKYAREIANGIVLLNKSMAEYGGAQELLKKHGKYAENLARGVIILDKASILTEENLKIIAASPRNAEEISRKLVEKIQKETSERHEIAVSEDFIVSHPYSDHEVNLLLNHYLRDIIGTGLVEDTVLNQRTERVLEQSIRDKIKHLEDLYKDTGLRASKIVVPITLENTAYVHGQHAVALYINYPEQETANPDQPPKITYIEPQENHGIPEQILDILQRVYPTLNPQDIVQSEICHQFDNSSCAPWTIEILKYAVMNDGAIPPQGFRNISRARQEHLEILKQENPNLVRRIGKSYEAKKKCEEELEKLFKENCAIP